MQCRITKRKLRTWQENSLIIRGFPVFKINNIATKVASSTKRFLEKTLTEEEKKTLSYHISTLDVSDLLSLCCYKKNSFQSKYHSKCLCHTNVKVLLYQFSTENATRLYSSCGVCVCKQQKLVTKITG